MKSNQIRSLRFQDLERLSKDIFEHLDVQEETKKDYARRIKYFINHVRFSKLDNNSFINFKIRLRNEKELSVSTKNKYLISAKIFLKEMYRQGYYSLDITENIKTFQQSKRHKKYGLTDEDIGKLMRYCRNLDDTKNNLRLRALIGLFLFQGLRQIEVIRLNVEDISFKSRQALIQGKGQEGNEIIYLHPKSVQLLRNYIKAYKLSVGPLFRSTSNNSMNKRLTTKTIRHLMKTVFKQVEIKNSVHGFRHYFTTTLLKKYGGDVFKVKQYTRHKNIETLEVYNDAVLRKEDLPKYYKVFKGLNF